MESVTPPNELVHKSVEVRTHQFAPERMQRLEVLFQTFLVQFWLADNLFTT